MYVDSRWSGSHNVMIPCIQLESKWSRIHDITMSYTQLEKMEQE